MPEAALSARRASTNEFPEFLHNAGFVLDVVISVPLSSAWLVAAYGGKKRVADMTRRLTATLGVLGLFWISSNALGQPPPQEVPPCPRGYILDFKAAVKGCSEVIRENPQAAWAYYSRGSANSAMGKTSLALADLTKAIELEPGNAPYLLFRALLFLHDNAFERAIADANKSIDLNPKSADGYLVRAIIHGKSGNFEGAAQDCNHALKINPETGESCKRVLASPPTAK